MRVLALDTSTDVGSVALLEEGELRAELAVRVQARHGESLLPRLQQLLSELGLTPGELDLVAVGTGPGSFTGVRIAMATAQGLGFATGLPVVGVGSLRVLASVVTACDPTARVATLVDAHKGEVFAAVYGREAQVEGVTEEQVAPFHAPPDEVAQRLRALAGEGPLRLVGSGLRRFASVFEQTLAPQPGRVQWLEPLFDVPRAAFLAREASLDFARHGPVDLRSLQAAYVRPSDAKLPAKPLRLPPS